MEMSLFSIYFFWAEIHQYRNALFFPLDIPLCVGVLQPKTPTRQRTYLVTCDYSSIFQLQKNAIFQQREDIAESLATFLYIETDFLLLSSYS